MQKAQNNFTVESLISKYRNFVKNRKKADEQLLLALYKTVAGESADTRIIDALLEYADTFQKDALSEEEYTYLCEKFVEVVSYEFTHRNEWFDDPELNISEERIRLVKEHVKPQKGARVFIADAEYCDLAVMFPDCIISGFTGDYDQQEVWALGQIRLYAEGIKSEIVSGEGIGEKYSYTLPPKGSIDVVIVGANGNKYFSQQLFGTSCNDIEALYDLLKPEGKMLFFAYSMLEMAGKVSYHSEILPFRNRIVSEKSISSIIEYEDIDFVTDAKKSFLLLIMENKHNKEVFFKDEKKKKNFSVKSESLCGDILWPSFYSTKRPEKGIPLSEIATFVNLKEKEKEVIKGDENWVLTEETKQKPVVVPAKMAMEYRDANLLAQNLDLAGNPDFENDKFWIRSIKERCILLYGNNTKTVVGYISEIPKTGIATLCPIVCIVPKDGIDVRYIAALLLTSEVKDQIVSICQGHINAVTFPLIMDKVIVPHHSDKERLAFLSEENYKALQSTQKEMKREHKNYIKAVRMRKHALTQSLSSIEAMFYALNEFRIRQNGNLVNDAVISRVKGTTVREAFEFISKNLENMMPALEHIAAVDYTFNKPEWIDPELFIEEYIKRNENGWLNFKSVTIWKQGHNQASENIKDPLSGDIIVPKGTSIHQFLFPKDALEHVFNNIISNAEAHGFDNKTRNDYQIRFSWHMDGIALIVEIDNNGSPISNEIDTASLLEYGVSTALHHDGHNGIGCNEIEDIMQRYDGKVQIVSSPEDEFPVKYILTFNHSNNVVSL
ncbi:MAG: ATP-binding protein [Paludibacteraceae bacterium]|nr:ATP-binding protein [Paludibacteraceae bacterium]MBP5662674.1 ATP-binding protein [Bacteroidales bacterium]